MQIIFVLNLFPTIIYWVTPIFILLKQWITQMFRRCSIVRNSPRWQRPPKVNVESTTPPWVKPAALMLVCIVAVVMTPVLLDNP